MKCQHPLEHRWQYPEMWMCCKCSQYFWGDKHESKSEGLYPWQELAKLQENQPNSGD